MTVHRMPADISRAFPPNYEEICKHIPTVRARGAAVVFTYGRTIHSPMSDKLRDDLMAHEMVHVVRQSNPEEWWSQYLTDPVFRLKEELLAYKAQYKYALEHYGKAMRKTILNSIATDLSGPLYGKLVTKREATRLIKADK